MAFEIKKDKISKSLGEDISVEAPSKNNKLMMKQETAETIIRQLLICVKRDTLQQLKQLILSLLY